MRELKNDLSKLVKTDDMGISDTQNVLAKLYRQTMWDRDITVLTLHKLFKLWEEDNARANMNKKRRSRIRSASIRAVAQDHITWRVFKSGLILLCVRRFSLTLGMRNDKGVKCIVKIDHNEGLSVLFERILAAFNINEYTFDQMLNAWWDRPDQQGLIEKHRGRKPKGNLKRGLVSESLTWTFLMKGLLVIGIIDVTFQLDLVWWDGINTSHVVHEVLKDNQQ